MKITLVKGGDECVLNSGRLVGFFSEMVPFEYLGYLDKNLNRKRVIVAPSFNRACQVYPPFPPKTSILSSFFLSLSGFAGFPKIS